MSPFTISLKPDPKISTSSMNQWFLQLLFFCIIFTLTIQQCNAQNYSYQNSAAVLEKANILMHNNKPEAALVLLKEAIKNFPNDPKVHQACYGCYMVQGKFDDALKEANIFIAMNPNPRWQYLLRARTKTKLGHFKDALCDYDKAAAPKESLYSPYFFEGRGQCKLGLGDLASAKTDLQNAAIIFLNSGYIFDAQDCIDAYMRIQRK